MAASVVAEPWFIWVKIGRFKACKVILGLVAISVADGTGGAAGVDLATALTGVFLVLLFLGRLATGGSLVAANREFISKALSSSLVSVCTSRGKGSPRLPEGGRGPWNAGIL